MGLLGRLRRGRPAAAQPLGLFLPGWGAPPELYRAGMPQGWRALDPPSFQHSHGSIDGYRSWVLDELRSLERPLGLAGHSMGGALAISAAAFAPECVTRLVLISPAGLPLSKPLHRSLVDFAGQLVRGRYPLAPVLEGLREALASPRAALSVARAVRALDLSREMTLVRCACVPTTVIGCTTDSLVTVAHCRRAASLLGARYRELELDGGHMWMLLAWSRFERELACA
jgi:pimeloyl-ACP methyl ester carboxylesterase